MVTETFHTRTFEPVPQLIGHSGKKLSKVWKLFCETKPSEQEHPGMAAIWESWFVHPTSTEKRVVLPAIQVEFEAFPEKLYTDFATKLSGLCESHNKSMDHQTDPHITSRYILIQELSLRLLAMSMGKYHVPLPDGVGLNSCRMAFLNWLEAFSCKVYHELTSGFAQTLKDKLDTPNGFRIDREFILDLGNLITQYRESCEQAITLVNAISTPQQLVQKLVARIESVECLMRRLLLIVSQYILSGNLNALSKGLLEDSPQKKPPKHLLIAQQKKVFQAINKAFPDKVSLQDKKRSLDQIVVRGSAACEDDLLGVFVGLAQASEYLPEPMQQRFHAMKSMHGGLELFEMLQKFRGFQALIQDLHSMVTQGGWLFVQVSACNLPELVKEFSTYLTQMRAFFLAVNKDPLFKTIIDKKTTNFLAWEVLIGQGFSVQKTEQQFNDMKFEKLQALVMRYYGDKFERLLVNQKQLGIALIRDTHQLQAVVGQQTVPVLPENRGEILMSETVDLVGDIANHWVSKPLCPQPLLQLCREETLDAVLALRTVFTPRSSLHPEIPGSHRKKIG